LVFPVDDLDSLELALRNLMQHPSRRQRFAVSAKTHAGELCSTGVVVDRLVSMYETVIDPAWSGSQ
jgi:hypothetical protein